MNDFTKLMKKYIREHSAVACDGASQLVKADTTMIRLHDRSGLLNPEMYRYAKKHPEIYKQVLEDMKCKGVYIHVR